MKGTGIVLVDDHRLFRDGIRNLLEQQDDMIVVAEAEDGKKAIDLVRKHAPEIVIMDLSMPNLNGIEATRRILTRHPGTRVIALSMHAHRRFVREMLNAGASGYLLKECAFEDLVEAINTVLQGQFYLSPKITRMVVSDYVNPTPADDASGISLLSPQEREILQLIAEGNSSKDISNVLHLSPRTVEKHRANIKQKLNISSLAELTKFAIREGLTPL